MIITPKHRHGSNIAWDIAALMERIATTDDPEQVAMWSIAVEELGDDFRGHVEATLEWATKLEMESVGIQHEIKRLQALYDERMARCERLRDAVKRWMQTVDTTEVACSKWTVRLKTNPPKVVIAEGTELPAEYVKTKVTETPDKTAIAAALKAGAHIKGCELIQEQRLEVK